jgi:hypothetical protein
MTDTIRPGPLGATLPWRLIRWSIIGAILLLPLVGMYFTDEIAWTRYDFALAAALLIGAGLLYELATPTIRNPVYRMVAGAVLLLAVLVIWAEGAVDVF